MLLSEPDGTHSYQTDYFRSLFFPTLWKAPRRFIVPACALTNRASRSVLGLFSTWGTFNLKTLSTVLPRFPDWTTCFLSMVCNRLSDTLSPIWWACNRCYPIRGDVYINCAVLKMQCTQWILERCFTTAAAVACCVLHLKKLKDMFVVSILL